MTGSARTGTRRRAHTHRASTSTKLEPACSLSRARAAGSWRGGRWAGAADADEAPGWPPSMPCSTISACSDAMSSSTPEDMLVSSSSPESSCSSALRERWCPLARRMRCSAVPRFSGSTLAGAAPEREKLITVVRQSEHRWSRSAGWAAAPSWVPGALRIFPCIFPPLTSGSTRESARQALAALASRLAGRTVGGVCVSSRQFHRSRTAKRYASGTERYGGALHVPVPRKSCPICSSGSSGVAASRREPRVAGGNGVGGGRRGGCSFCQQNGG